MKYLLSKYVLSVMSIAAVSLSLTANAALHKRGDHMVYDDVLNITWLLDANYAATSGYAAANLKGNDRDYTDTAVWSDGRMGWTAAKTWASQLTIMDTTYGAVDGWRLASARLQTPVNYDWKNDGGSDRGYNITRSELGHMFFNNLGNKAYYDVNGNKQSGYGVKNNVYTDSRGSITIQNLRNSFYWNDETYLPIADNKWAFSAVHGSQNRDYEGSTFFAWAVRDGDVASEVPLPAAAWLFGAALAGLAGVRRRK